VTLKTAMAREPAARQKSSRFDRAAAGGELLGSMMLSPEATRKLAAHVAKGAKKTAVVNRLLEQSEP